MTTPPPSSGRSRAEFRAWDRIAAGRRMANKSSPCRGAAVTGSAVCCCPGRLRWPRGGSPAIALRTSTGDGSARLAHGRLEYQFPAGPGPGQVTDAELGRAGRSRAVVPHPAGTGPGVEHMDAGQRARGVADRVRDGSWLTGWLTRCYHRSAGTSVARERPSVPRFPGRARGGQAPGSGGSRLT